MNGFVSLALSASVALVCRRPVETILGDFVKKNGYSASVLFSLEGKFFLQDNVVRSASHTENGRKKL